ncbi:TPA: replication-associated recombination protein A [Candidatus Poribacteria bacterium]|nr:replication-associated recombination protein A [Candidatus Poribacteria bacterium]
MELFEQKFQRDIKKSGPLANRIRPNNFEEFVGQEEILGERKPLRQAIEQDKISSFILWGPPGSGKTSLVNIIANLTKAHFERFNATTSGVPELRKVIQDADERRKLYNRKTILFLDEIHRFNKLQQDALLSSVESGVITLIGATTENPSFELNSPLLSRLQVYQLKPLDAEAIKTIIDRALKDKERGLGEYRVQLSEEAMDQLIFIADGDVRLALNALELAVQTCKPDENNVRFITAPKIQAAAQKKILKYDKAGEEHYNLISAYIKSIRGSDPNASIYWLARMLEAGEDPRFIARRLVILASEDIGNADPQALVVATAAAQAVEFVGLPEAQINLAQATTYLSCAPKSNASYMALLAALEDVRRLPAYPVPLHLRNAPTQLMKELGYGEGYRYAHDYEGNVVEQQYLPEELKDKVYYHPK